MPLKKYLPIGSVVLLKDARKRLMIYGRRPVDSSTGKEYDYCACMYPEGHINDETIILFNADQISEVFFVGYKDIEERHMQEVLTETGV